MNLRTQGYIGEYTDFEGVKVLSFWAKVQLNFA